MVKEWIRFDLRGKKIMDNKSVLHKLLRNVLIIIIIITGLILAQQKVYNDYVSTSISKSYLTDIAFRAEEQFISFYKPIESSLILSQKWGQAGLLAFSDIPTMNARFIPILEQFPQIHSAKIVSKDQEVYALTREEDQWISGVIKNKKDPQRFLLQYWSKEGKFIKEEWSKTEYDVFQRPWYLAAKDSAKTDQVWWTKPRFIISAQSPGITASVKWENKRKNNQLYVLAFDVLLKDIFQSISNLRVSENSHVFLLRGDGTVFNLTTSDSLFDFDKYSKKYFVDHRQLNMPHITEAIKIWQEQGMPVDDPIDFSLNQTSYWVGVRYIDREHSNLWIGVVIPENDVLNQLQRRQMNNLSISAAIFLLGIIVAILMIRRYRKQLTIRSLTILESDDLENKIREIVRKGESSTVEFKSTMRMNLKTMQPGKEIELAWLKATTAFMNSEGGILLLGVNDDGEFIGIEADKFENEDKCGLHFKNLINQHIGAEFTSYLNFKVLNIENKTVAILESKSSQKPVFLKNKNEEYFYIRSGPSSIKLQTSKVLEYIEDRKA
jgi:hypothetical protein